jgi:hypothetical protein
MVINKLKALQGKFLRVITGAYRATLTEAVKIKTYCGSMVSGRLGWLIVVGAGLQEMQNKSSRTGTRTEANVDGCMLRGSRSEPLLPIPCVTDTSH